MDLTRICEQVLSQSQNTYVKSVMERKEKIACVQGKGWLYAFIVYKNEDGERRLAIIKFAYGGYVRRVMDIDGIAIEQVKDAIASVL